MRSLRPSPPSGPALRPLAVPVVVAVLMALAATDARPQTGTGRAPPATGESPSSPASPTAPAELPPGPPVSTPPATPPRQRLPGHYDETPVRPRGMPADVPMNREDLQAQHRRQLEAFDKADANGDGRLSPAEMNTYRAAMRRDRLGPPKAPKPPQEGGPAQGVPSPRG